MQRLLDRIRRLLAGGGNPRVDDGHAARPEHLVQHLDEEFGAEPGTTLLERSRTQEEHPELHPRSPLELAHKMKAEASEGEGLPDKAKWPT